MRWTANDELVLWMSQISERLRTLYSFVLVVTHKVSHYQWLTLADLFLRLGLPSTLICLENRRFKICLQTGGMPAEHFSVDEKLHNSPEASVDPSTVSAIAINAPAAASASPLCNLSSMASSNKLSRASDVRSAASGGLEVILTVAMANESNLSTTSTHSCRMLFGLDPWLTISRVSGSDDGDRYLSQTSSPVSSPKAYRRGPASESVIHCFATS